MSDITRLIIAMKLIAFAARLIELAHRVAPELRANPMAEWKRGLPK